MIPRTQLQMMAANFARRAEQHDKLGDTEGADKYRGLAQSTSRILLTKVSDEFGQTVLNALAVKDAVDAVITSIAQRPDQD